MFGNAPVASLAWIESINLPTHAPIVDSRSDLGHPQTQRNLVNSVFALFIIGADSAKRFILGFFGPFSQSEISQQAGKPSLSPTFVQSIYSHYNVQPPTGMGGCSGTGTSGNSS